MNDPVQSFGAFPGQLITVGDQNDSPMRGFRGPESADRFRQCLLDIGAAHGDRIDRKFIHTLQKTGLVDGQRTFQKRFAGKRDQAEPANAIRPNRSPGLRVQSCRTSHLA